MRTAPWVSRLSVDGFGIAVNWGIAVLLVASAPLKGITEGRWIEPGIPHSLLLGCATDPGPGTGVEPSPPTPSPRSCTTPRAPLTPPRDHARLPGTSTLW